MLPQLLPASAAAFAPRASSVNVILGSISELWLIQTLKRLNHDKRPLNSVPQHQKFLNETLSPPSAIWILTSLMLQKAPEADLSKDSNPLVEALFNFQLIHIEAYVVHVDMVLSNEVAFKLIPDSVQSLIDYHKEIYCVDVSANTYNWTDKKLQVQKLHEEFIQAINKFVYRTDVFALEGLEDEGAGELQCGKSEEVKNRLLRLFLPLLPPPPRIVDTVRPRNLLPRCTECTSYIPPSFPSTTPSGDSNFLLASMTLNEIQSSYPVPSVSSSYLTAGNYYGIPRFYVPIPALPLPSVLAQQRCGGF